MMEPVPGDTAYRRGEILLSASEKDLDARTRLPSVLPIAVYTTLTHYVEAKKPKNLADLMGDFEYNYKAKAISLDGKARQEYVDLEKFEAIGGQDDSDLAMLMLNEGNKKNEVATKKGKK
jgi:hypothetical protein